MRVLSQHLKNPFQNHVSKSSYTGKSGTSYGSYPEKHPESPCVSLACLEEQQPILSNHLGLMTFYHAMSLTLSVLNTERLPIKMVP